MSRSRGGFTLFEMILALGIGVILLGSLYTLLETQTEQTDQAQRVIQEAALVRSVFQRMTADLQGCLASIDPKLLPESGAVEGTTTTTTTASEDETMPAEAYAPAFNVGIQGEATYLMMTTGRMPREVLGRDQVKLNASPPIGDLRHVTYWLLPEEEGGGLARRELAHVTSVDADIVPPNIPSGSKYMLAKEVVGLEFGYVDGRVQGATEIAWRSLDLDEETLTLPKGPPSAVVVTLTFRSEVGEPRTYRQVIALPGGNNFPIP